MTAGDDVSGGGASVSAVDTNGAGAERFETQRSTAELAEAERNETSQHLRLYEEILQVHKERVERGEVTIRKEIVTEMRTIEVPVSREELVITRRAVAGAEGEPVAGEIGGDEVIRIPLSEERLRVEKDHVVLEDVSIKKRVVTETQTVSAEVRREELRVDTSGVAPASGDGKTEFSARS